MSSISTRSIPRSVPEFHQNFTNMLHVGLGLDFLLDLRYSYTEGIFDLILCGSVTGKVSPRISVWLKGEAFR